MRLVTKKAGDRTKRLASPETMAELTIIALTGNKSLIKDSIYRDPYETLDGRRSLVADKLAIVYLHKCAYCESLGKADIEHYRPKKKVQDDPNHEGYYWLCYEWTNLIPACIACNREGGKHCHFPVLGNRVMGPVFSIDTRSLSPDFCRADNLYLKSEKPYLLHPEIDDPDLFFAFEIDTNNEGIRIIGIDVDGRGERTIEICKLNRLDLKIERERNVISEFTDAIECVVGRYVSNEITGEDLLSLLNSQLKILKNQSTKAYKTHTFLRRFIVKNRSNFESIVFHYLADPCKNLLTPLLNNYFL